MPGTGTLRHDVPLPHALIADLVRLGADVQIDVPVARRTWWRVGGPADALVTLTAAASVAPVLALLRAGAVPWVALGNGSNVLVADAGVRGAVIRLAGELASMCAVGEPPALDVGGGLQLPVLVGRAGKAGWTGLEGFAGIPGTVGGAVRMNAGTSLGDTASALVAVDLGLPDGLVRVSAAGLSMSYRHAELPVGAVVLSARLQTTGADPVASRMRVTDHLAHRARTQPVDVKTCGSTFRNPPGDFAGRLVEAAGLKGARFGAVRVSPVHANFIENLGGATAAQIWEVVCAVRQAVWDRTGVTLVPEVERIGAWADQGQGPADA